MACGILCGDLDLDMKVSRDGCSFAHFITVSLAGVFDVLTGVESYRVGQ